MKAIKAPDSRTERELQRQAEKIDTTLEVDPPERTPHRISVDVPALAVVKVLAILLGAYLLVQVWPVLTLLVVALMLAAALAPFLNLLEERGLPRPLALTAVGLTLLLALAVLGVLVVPGLVHQTRSLLAHSDQYVASLQAMLRQHGMRVNLLTQWHGLPKRFSTFNTTLLAAVQLVFDGGVAVATVFFVTVYLLSDQERIKAFFVGMFPEERRTDVLRVLAELRRQVGGYVRGQLITSALAGVFAFIVLTAAGVPDSIALGAFVAVVDLVPLFGQLLGTIPSVLIALTISPLKALIVLAGFIIYQQVENHLIAPRVYSNTMNVSPLVAPVGVLIGARLLGMLGMLIALPLIASLPVLLDYAGVHLRGARPAGPALTDASEDLRA